MIVEAFETSKNISRSKISEKVLKAQISHNLLKPEVTDKSKLKINSNFEIKNQENKEKGKTNEGN